MPTTGPARTRLTVGIMITVAVLAFEALAVATIGPRIAHDLGGDDLYGWLFSAFMLANLVGIVLAGHESDRRGPAVVYVVGLGCFGAGLVLGGLAPSMLVLVAARAVQGLGAGALYNAAYVAVGRAFTETERPRVFALLSSAWVVPGLVAPALGGVVAELFGWRWVFLGMIVLVPLAAVLALPPMRALGSGRPDDATPPIAAAVLLAGGAALLLAGLGVASVWITPPLVVVGVALAVTQIRRLTPPGTLRARRGLPAAVAFRGLSTFSFFGADAFLAFALARLHGLDPIAVGLVITPATLTWTAASWVQARLAGRRSRRALATAGAVCIAVGIAMASVVVIEDVSLAVIVVAWAIGGFGMGLSYSPTSLVALSEAAPGRQGAATSSVQLTDVLGAALGTGLAGAIVAAAASLDLTRRDALTVVFALMAVVALLAIAVARRFPPDPPELRRAGLQAEPVPDDRIGPPTWVTFWTRYDRGLWEPETRAVLERFLHPGTTFVDIGAWIGPVTLWACELGAEVIAVEPDPVAHAALVHNTRHHPVRVVPHAIAAQAGVRYLAPAAPDGTETYGDSVSRLADAGIEVSSITPATLLAGVDPTFVKIDIEGGEGEVLPLLLPLLHCPILVSWHEDELDVSLEERRAWFDGWVTTPVRGDGWTGTSEMLAEPAPS